MLLLLLLRLLLLLLQSYRPLLSPALMLLLLLLSPVLRLLCCCPAGAHVLQVGQADLHHAALQAIGGNLQQAAGAGQAAEAGRRQQQNI
jgi:hypothetical protein